MFHGTAQIGFSDFAYRRSLHCAVALLLALGAVLPCRAGSTLAPADRAVLAQQHRFTLRSSTDPIASEIAQCCADANGRIGKPEDRWAPTDALSGSSSLPRRRLIWIAQGNEFVVVHYEQGGFAHTYHVVAIRKLPGAAKGSLVWRAATGRLKDYAGFVRALAANDLQEEPASER